MAANQAYEVVFWQEGQDPLTKGRGIKSPPPFFADTIDLAIAKKTVGAALVAGEYQWGIFLVATDSYVRLTLVSNQCRFRIP